jgi:glycerol-3-phosphate O-acyltransferase
LPFESDSTQPVLYVLADRSQSDLLALSHTNDSRSLPSPLDSLSISPDDHYPSVYWGQPLAKQKRWLQDLFANTWAWEAIFEKFLLY